MIVLVLVTIKTTFMKRTFCFLSAVILAATFVSCSSKPSDKDIQKKALLEYVCNETAKVNDFKVLRTQQTEGMSGDPVYQYTISGEVEWPDGCKEMGTNTAPGAKEKFEKTVSLYKDEDGNWQ